MRPSNFVSTAARVSWLLWLALWLLAWLWNKNRLHSSNIALFPSLIYSQNNLDESSYSHKFFLTAAFRLRLVWTCHHTTNNSLNFMLNDLETCCDVPSEQKTLYLCCTEDFPPSIRFKSKLSALKSSLEKLTKLESIPDFSQENW